MTRARQMAADIGVDRLCWELTDHPEDMFSRRFVPGTADLAAIKHEIWDDNNLGNAIPGATPRARIDVTRSAARPAARRPRRPPAHRPDEGPQPLVAALPRAGELRPPSGPRRRAALRSATARSSTATTNAPGCRRRSSPDATVDVRDDDHRAGNNRGATG